MTGDILPHDFEKFRQTTASTDKALVALSSNGGSVLDGIQIGRLIRLKNFATVVVDGDRCASACALAWLGGTKRFVGFAGRIGFHAARNQDGQETGAGNAIIGAYLNEIGLSYDAVFYITKAHPNEMTWLSSDEAKNVGIEFSVIAPRTAEDGNRASPEATLQDRANESICVNALTLQASAWTGDPVFSQYIAEAQRRGLTVDDCRQLLEKRHADALKATPKGSLQNRANENICVNALNGQRTGWERDPAFSQYTAEAQRRRLTIDDCRQLAEKRSADAAPTLSRHRTLRCRQVSKSGHVRLSAI